MYYLLYLNGVIMPKNTLLKSLAPESYLKT